MKERNNHDLAQDIQKGIYGEEKVFVLEKYKLIEYVLENQLIFKDKESFKSFVLKHKLNGEENGFLKTRSTEKLFSSYLITVNTENTLNVTKKENLLKSVLKKISDQEKYQKITNIKNKEAGFIQYLSLQKTRSIQEKLKTIEELLENSKDIYIIDQKNCLIFQEEYNKKIIDLDKKNIEYYKKYIDSYVRINVKSKNLTKNLIFVSENDTVTLNFFFEKLQQYKQDVKILKKYEKYFNSIELMVVDFNRVYLFTNKKEYDELNKIQKEELQNFIAENWNTFSIISGYKYVIVSKQCESIDYIINILFDLYNSQMLGLNYDYNFMLLETILEALKTS